MKYVLSFFLIGLSICSFAANSSLKTKSSKDSLSAAVANKKSSEDKSSNQENVQKNEKEAENLLDKNTNSSTEASAQLNPSKQGSQDSAQAETSRAEEELKQAEAWVQQAENKKINAENIENKKESEIPVLNTAPATVSNKKSSASAKMLWSVVFVLGLLGAFAMYAKRNFLKAPKNKNTQIKVLTQHYLGPKKSLAIVRVAGESILIGVTDQNINLIKTLALMDEEIPQETPNDFQSSFSKFFTKKDLHSQNQDQQDNGDQDEFSISKIKDVVSGKLKNMKEI